MMSDYLIILVMVSTSLLAFTLHYTTTIVGDYNGVKIRDFLLSQHASLDFSFYDIYIVRNQT